jgi:regulator of sirC expression with transglutaminase-like and TPR domain
VLFFAAVWSLVTLRLSTAPVIAQTRQTPAEIVREGLSGPETRLDYLEAAITFDQLIDKNSDTAATRAMVERLVDAARQMAGPRPTDAYKLAAIRQAIYVGGLWNYKRAFSYDLADPLGTKVRSKMLSTYVRTRKGNCVSMPTLFLIVADRMGLKVRLAAAPLHLFVRYTDSAGTDHNLEATSGGHEARLEWYRRNLPMTDRALESGLYMRTLSRRETAAAMATSVLAFLMDEQRYQEAMEVADVLLAANPRDAYAMVLKGSAAGALIKAEYQDRFPNPELIPPALRARLLRLGSVNAQAFRDAEALGWREAAR